MSKNILVALSGGIDSAITAWKLKDSGFNVLGVHFRFWKWQGSDSEYERERTLIQRICDILDIPLREVDARAEFKQKIIEDMLKSLGKGFTPNPCIHCNPTMKFDLLTTIADSQEIGLIATGHYVISKKNKDGRVSLYKSIDRSKDQSYFLCKLSQRILERCLFPLGETTKKENKILAENIGLRFDEKPESQDLCFLTNNTYSDFINQEIPEIMIPGNIRDTKGEIIGRHHGLPNYTIGQRKGIEIPSEKPFYVVSKNIEKNELVIGSAESLKFGSMIVSGVNWISEEMINQLECDVKIRYRSPDYHCNIKRKLQDEYTVEFYETLRDVTPGQYAVFYRGDEMLGGGMIMAAGNSDV